MVCDAVSRIVNRGRQIIRQEIGSANRNHDKIFMFVWISIK